VKSRAESEDHVALHNRWTKFVSSRYKKCLDKESAGFDNLLSISRDTTYIQRKMMDSFILVVLFTMFIPQSWKEASSFSLLGSTFVFYMFY